MAITAVTITEAAPLFGATTYDLEDAEYAILSNLRDRIDGLMDDREREAAAQR